MKKFMFEVPRCKEETVKEFLELCEITMKLFLKTTKMNYESYRTGTITIFSIMFNDTLGE